ncbi:MAG: glycosyl hydrolase-related protein [Ignavibacteriales bacterium]|nr:glycosyl hydrolase-related protein [Ignavibacteriales bacterium]
METTKQYKGIVVSHTHWDRAWYWPFEHFRIRLVQTIDQLIDLLNSNPAFKSFTLDGQTIMLEDYLEIRPERRAELERLISARRLIVGPWFVPPDEFLVSPEALIRNLMIGHKTARQFGYVMKEGYVPDSFGHIRQLPQILQGFGLRSFIFQRGMGREIEDLGTEFWWEAPDGSRVLAINQRDNYGNLASWGFPFEFGDIRTAIPDPQVALENVTKTFESLKKYARMQYVLFSNGIDHLPVQPQVPELIRFVNDKLQNLRLVQGNFSDFVDAIVSSGTNTLQTYKGELTGNHHHLILRSVYSARMPLKQRNAFCQRLLEHRAEPAAAWAALETKQDFTPFVWQAWKELLKAHPHDDICGCGIDEIHRDNMHQFEHVEQISSYVEEHAWEEIGKRIDTAGKLGKPVLLTNALNWDRKEVVCGTILFGVDDPIAKQFQLVDAQGVQIPFVRRKTAPLKRMEILRDADYVSVDIEMLTGSVPACGYATIYAVEGKPPVVAKTMKASSRVLENEFLKAKILPNGSIQLMDKLTKAVFTDLNMFEDTEDAGDEYTYSWIDRSKTLTTRRSRPTVRLVSHSALEATIAVSHVLKLPVGLKESRTARSPVLTNCPVISFVTLKANAHRLEIRTEITNTAKDHRLRVLFPTDIKARTVFASGHCDVLEREHAPLKRPTMQNRFEYYGTQHNDLFICVEQDSHGLMIANKGLPEYESTILKKGTAIALTLMRCVGMLSRGDFATRVTQAGPHLAAPDAQLPGPHIFEYAVIPYSGTWLDAPAVREAHSYVNNLRLHNINPNKGPNKGILAESLSFLRIEPQELIVSAVKRSEDKSGTIVRFFNISNRTVKGEIHSHRPLQRVDLVSMNEELVETLPLDGDAHCSLPVTPKKIVTLKLTYR